MPSPGGILLSPRVAIPSLVEESLPSERVVLGSVLMDPARLADLTVTGPDFANHHQPILDAMLGLALTVHAFDMSTLIDELQRRGQLGAVGGRAYIFSLTEGLPRHVALEQHCAKIRSSSLRRKLARLCDRVLAGCSDLTIDPAIALAQLLEQVADIDAPAHGADLGLVSADEVAPETTEWLIEPYLPKKCLSLLVGDPGDGKSFAALSFSGALTRGKVLFAGITGSPQNVIYLSNEDSAGELRSRFDRMGGDPKRLWFESAERAINLGQAAAIEAAVQKHEAALVVVDTITSHFGGKIDFHKASEVAAVLAPLSALARRTGVAILGLMHMSKAIQAKSLYRVQGSTAFAGAARSVLGIGPDTSEPARPILASDGREPTRRILVHMKVNGSAKASSRKFLIDDHGVTWGELSGLGAADVLGAETQAEDRSEMSGATEFLREALGHGSRDAEEVKAEAKSQGISDRTLRRAKLALGVESRKKSVREGWIWWLAAKDGQGGQGGQGGPTVQ
jgi:putative DNA primase/helicase